MTRVLIVDDQPGFRRHLRRLLDYAGLTVVGEAGDIPEAETLVQALQPDLAVVDVMLPGVNGLEGTPRLKALAPNLRVILVSAHLNHAELFQAAAAEASAEAFIVKDDLDIGTVQTWKQSCQKGGVYTQICNVSDVQQNKPIKSNKELKMNTRKWLIASGTVILVMLALAAGISLAQEPEPPEGNVNRVSGVEEAAAVSSRIPVQGRLTDASGNPLNGTYSIRFALYDAATGDNTVCADTNSVSVENGLFYSEIWGSCDSSDMNGRQLYLGIKVGSDDEMTDRQAIYPVPYAFSLKPGAVISGSSSSAILTVENHGSGTGVAVSSSDGDGVSASSNASDHAAVYGYNSNTGNGVEGVGHAGVGVRGTSFAGVGIEAGSVFSAALRATGTGIIQSTAKSYVWISGNGVRPYQQSDTTVIDMDTVGGALIYRGATTGDKNVMLPITVVGPLYGQDVTISALDIYWKGDTDFDAIAAVILRRQTGVCSSASCYADIVFDVGGTGYTCEDSVYPEGCTLHYDATSNNVLTADSGILYLTLGLAFSGSGTWVEIGGVRLTLEHD